MSANRKHYSSKEDIPKEGDEGGGGDDGGGGGGGSSASTEPNKHAKDEVDFVLTSSKANGASVTNGKKGQEDSITKTGVTLDKFNIFHLRRRPKSDPGTGPIAKHAASQQMASQQMKNGGAPPTSADETLKKKKSRFVKSASIARIFGNTYNTKKYDDSSALLKLQQFKRSFLNSEKFHKKDSGAGAPEDTDDGELQIGDSCYVNDSENSAKAIKSITRGLGRLLRRNCHSIDISRPDPEYKVSYLGNVLTGWAKGDGCVEKPLATLWRNYTQNSKPDVMMKLCLCPSGLKATTRQHGLTEYWSHRITYCSSPKNYPRVFCWIYRHEGRKLKHEFRCHAVICSKETIAQEISTILKENLAKALREFKRDKLNRQNARLSLANSVYDNPSMPRRKIMLSVGANNYRPPLERSKSAPKLMAIEEMIGEEDEEENETQEGEGAMGARTSKAGTSTGGSTVLEACCREDALFPSTTLGRRRCRRGHSIRRSRLRNSFKSPKDVEARVPLKNENIVHVSPMNKSVDSILDTISQEDGEEDEHDLERENGELQPEQSETMPNSKMAKSSKLSHNSDSSEDDFEAFLAHYNYNSSEPLSTELISYFDMKLNPTTVCSMHDLSQHHGSLPVTLEDTQRLALSLDDLDSYSLPGVVDESEAPEVRTRELKDRDVDLETDEAFFNQDEVLEMLRTAAESAASASVSHRRLSDDRLRHSGCLHTEDDTAPPSLLCVTSKLQGAGGATHPDSDEGSISSGCETSSTVTTNTDDSGASGNGSITGRSAAVASLGKPGSVLERVRSFEQLAENQVIHVPLGERTGHQVPQEVGNVTSSPELIFKRSITFPAPGVKSSFLMPMTMAGSAAGASEPIDSPLNSLNSSLVETRRDEPSHHHQTIKPKVRQMRLKSTVAAVNTELINHLQAIDSDSEFSDESGYVEFQDNQPSIKSVTA